MISRPRSRAIARIGCVTTSYPRESGDPAGAFVAGFARFLVEAGHAVEVIAAGPGAPLVDGIPVERIDGGGLFYDGGAPDALAQGGLAWAHAASFQARLALRAARRAGRWDAVVSHWVVPSALAVEAAFAALGRRAPHLAIAHSSDVALLQRSTIGRRWLRRLSTRADLVYAARHLVVDGAPGRVVPMGVEAPSGDRARGRARFGMLQRTTALYLGRLVPVKGVELLLAALPPSLDLVVAGEGPLGGSLRGAAVPLGPRVRFVGEVRGAAKHDLLAAADLLVVPSRALPDGRTEGTPTVLLEGLAAGLPVIATRVGGAPEVIRDDVDGLLVTPTAPALRQALDRLAEDPSLRERLAANARHTGDRHLWPAVGPRLLGQLLDGANGAARCEPPVPVDTPRDAPAPAPRAADARRAARHGPC